MEISTGWLTAKRLRAHGIILAVCLWSLYVWNLAIPGLRDRAGNLKGTDFLHFYTIGSLALAQDGAHLYDMNAQAAIAIRRVPQSAGIRYLPLYPPQVSLLFLPLAQLSYGWALALWWTCSAAYYAAVCWAFWYACPNLRGYGGTVALLALGYPAFFHVIAWGQTSIIALLCFAAAFFLLRAKHSFYAGLALGCLAFKPQLAIAAAVVLLFIGRWKIISGGILSAGAQFAIGVLYYGTGPLRQWLYMLRHVSSQMALLEPKLYQTHSLRTFWSMLLPWDHVAFVIYLLTAILVLGLTTQIWRRGESVPLRLRYSVLLLATVLVAPHLTVYDLVILAPAILLLADWVKEHTTIRRAAMLGTLLYLVYALPLIGPLSKWTHLQPSVVAMAATLFLLWRISVRDASSQTEGATIS